jgi:hypothetical protein
MNPPATPRCSVVTVGNVGGRIDRQLVLGRRDGRSYWTGHRIERIPHRERHTEEALAADAPVAVQPVGPVLEARLHVRRCHCSSAPRSSSASRNSSVLMNHWRLVMISSGRSPFS